MNDAWLGSKYLVFPGNTLHTVTCSFWGLSFSRQGSITPPPLSTSPRRSLYHLRISSPFAALKNTPPIPRIRPLGLTVAFLSCAAAAGAVVLGGCVLSSRGCCEWQRGSSAIATDRKRNVVRGIHRSYHRPCRGKPPAVPTGGGRLRAEAGLP